MVLKLTSPYDIILAGLINCLLRHPYDDTTRGTHGCNRRILASEDVAQVDRGLEMGDHKRTTEPDPTESLSHPPIPRDRSVAPEARAPTANSARSRPRKTIASPLVHGDRAPSARAIRHREGRTAVFPLAGYQRRPPEIKRSVVSEQNEAILQLASRFRALEASDRSYVKQGGNAQWTLKVR